MNSDSTHKVKCTNGWAYVYQQGYKREGEQEAAERVTYTICPITGNSKTGI